MADSLIKKIEQKIEYFNFSKDKENERKRVDEEKRIAIVKKSEVG